MEIFEIIELIETNLKLKDQITEELYNINIELSQLKKDYRLTYAKMLEKYKNIKAQKDYTAAALTNDIYTIELLEEKKMYLFNKLTNIRQELNILSVLLKNEKELL